MYRKTAYLAKNLVLLHRCASFVAKRRSKSIRPRLTRAELISQVIFAVVIHITRENSSDGALQDWAEQ